MSLYYVNRVEANGSPWPWSSENGVSWGRLVEVSSVEAAVKVVANLWITESAVPIPFPLYCKVWEKTDHGARLLGVFGLKRTVCYDWFTVDPNSVTNWDDQIK